MNKKYFVLTLSLLLFCIANNSTSCMHEGLIRHLRNEEPSLDDAAVIIGDMMVKLETKTKEYNEIRNECNKLRKENTNLSIRNTQLTNESAEVSDGRLWQAVMLKGISKIIKEKAENSEYEKAKIAARIFDDAAEINLGGRGINAVPMIPQQLQYAEIGNTIKSSTASAIVVTSAHLFTETELGKVVSTEYDAFFKRNNYETAGYYIKQGLKGIVAFQLTCAYDTAKKKLGK